MTTYTPIAYPLSFSSNPQRDRLECSNQVLLPPEILQNEIIGFPVFFTLTNGEHSLNVAVLEFTDIPDVVYIPWYILNLLGLQEGGRVNVSMIEDKLPSATEITLMPHEHEFITMMDPKTILEHFISKNYPIISLNEIIKIKYLDTVYNLSVTHIEPSYIVNMIDCDVNLSFERALDYITPPPSPVLSPNNDPIDSNDNIPSIKTDFSEFKNQRLNQMGFIPFGGKGNRLGDS